MAVISTTVTINNKQYRKTYSDSGYYIERDGMQFSEAVDVLGADFIYTETDTPIETENDTTVIEKRIETLEETTEITATAVEELIGIVMGGEE